MTESWKIRQCHTTSTTQRHAEALSILHLIYLIYAVNVEKKHTETLAAEKTAVHRRNQEQHLPDEVALSSGGKGLPMPAIARFTEWGSCNRDEVIG